MGSRRRIDEATLENIITESKASCNKGWLVELFYVTDVDKPYHRCYLRNLYTSKKVKFPNLPGKFKYSKQILTSPPTEQHQPCFVLSLIENESKLIFCRLGDLTWSEWPSDHYVDVDDSIKFNDKVYALSGGRRPGELWEIEIQGGKLVPKRYRARLPVSSLFCIYGLVESCGELFAVGRKSIFDTDVFKMDFSKNCWERVFKLSQRLDRCFAFLGTSSASFSAAEFGVSDNTIFFKETELGITKNYDRVTSKEKDDDPSLYSFNLTDLSLSVWNNRRVTRTNLQDDRDQMVIISKKHTEKFQEEERESRWFQLPLGTQMSVFQGLSQVYDWMNIRAVCREWRSLVRPIQWCPENHPFEYPWLMFPHEGMRYNFFDPIGNLMHSISIPELENCKVRFSHQGWLLVTRAPNSVFFFEPFTRQRIQLPELWVYEGCYDAFGVSGTPTSMDWQVFGIRYSIPRSESLLIYHLQAGRADWICHPIDCSDHLPCPSFSNLVFDGQCFCYLGKNGKVSCFNMTELGWFRRGLSSSTTSFSKYWRQFLVRYQDELISVWIDETRNSMDVFKLDSQEDKWVEIKSLDDKMLYLSQTTTLAVGAMPLPPRIKNTVQFSMFSDIHGNANAGNISYSFKDQSFKSTTIVFNDIHHLEIFMTPKKYFYVVLGFSL